MNPKIFDIAVKIGLVLAALGPVLAMIGTLIKTISGITSAIGFLTTPMGNVILAIGLLVAAGVALYQNWDTIKAKAIELKDKVTEAFEKIRTAIVEKINAAKAALSPFIEKIKEAISWVRNLFSASSEASSISVPRNYVNAMQSGGFGNMMSGGISISNSFVINGVEQLSNARLIEIADVITDRVNENLGVAV